MAICAWCEREMKTAPSCTVRAFHRSGVTYPLAPHGNSAQDRRWSDIAAHRCGDCGVVPGGFHHPGCDMAECPACRRQLLSCGCRFDEDGDEDEDDW